MGLFPKIDVDGIRKELNAKFDQLITKLDEILIELKRPK